MNGERPASGRFLEGRRGELFGFEALGERVSDVLRGRGVAREPRDHGGDGRRISHYSAPSFHPRHSPPLVPAPHPPIHKMVNNLIPGLSTAWPRLVGLVSGLCCAPLRG